MPLHTSDDTAEREVFLKTISFFCALKEKGCTLSLEDGILECESADLLEYDDDADVEGEFDHIVCASRRPKKHKACKGALVLVFDKFNQPLIQSVGLFFFPLTDTYLTQMRTFFAITTSPSCPP